MERQDFDVLWDYIEGNCNGELPEAKRNARFTSFWEFLRHVEAEAGMCAARWCIEHAEHPFFPTLGELARALEYSYVPPKAEIVLEGQSQAEQEQMSKEYLEWAKDLDRKLKNIGNLPE